MAPPRRATRLNDEGNKLKDAGRLDEAIAAYAEACDLAPGWSTPFYNLGLLHKHQKQWEPSLKYNRRATQLDAKNEAAWWNMGIAATAVGRWDLAREAWRGFGIDIPDGEGPLDFFCGVGPVRLNPAGDGEVVWGRRLCPVRMQLVSVPLPESGHCWYDVVLNDGQPVGYRQHQGRDVPVFDALELLERGAFNTYTAGVAMPADPALIARLAELADEHGGAAEDWSASIRYICKACSEGRPHARHDHDLKLPENGPHVIGVAARDRAHATAILQAWEAERADSRVEWLNDALVRG